MAELILYTYWRSSCSYRVRLALGHKELAHESAFVNLLEGEQKKSEHRSRSPIGHVPALTIDGVTYVESVAIMELLEELYPQPPLLPAKPHERARVRALVETINSGIQPLQNLSVVERVGAEPALRAAWMKHFMARGLAAMEAQMASNEAEGVRGPFAFGESFSMADCCLVPQVYSARRVGLDLAPFPRIVRAEAAAADLPFVAVASPEAQGDAKI